MAQALMQRSEVALRPHLQKFLISAIQGNATRSELKQDWHILILQVRHTPPTLDSIIAMLIITAF